jgi:hypothetical protein
LSGRRLPRRHLWLALAALLAAGPRLALLPFNENLFGDAIPRTELAERWAQAPHLITAFGDGAGQFGPLHLYLIGAALHWFDREDAGRIVSLLFGLLSVVPLSMLGRRLFGWPSGVVAALCLAVWGLHVQFSTTAGSESVSVCLMLGTLAAFAAGLDSGRIAHYALAALCLNLACAVRYDPWLYIVLLPAAVALTRRRPAVAMGNVSAFVSMSLAFPVLWMTGNQQLHGDVLYPFRFIDAEHARLTAMEAGGWREPWLRLQGVAFWPALALISLTPGVAILGVAGMVRAWRQRPEHRWLIVATLAPLAYYAVRTTVLFDFVPLVRFMATPLSVMLVFVHEGYVALSARLSRRQRRQVAIATATAAVLVPLAIGAATFQVDGVVADVLRSVSPSSTNPRAVMRAATAVRDAVRRTAGSVAVDSDDRYRDLSLIFYSRLRDDEVQRVRWPGFDARFDADPPEFVVLFDRGWLSGLAAVSRDGPALTIRGQSYVEIGGVEPPMRLYRRTAGVSDKIGVCPDRRAGHYEHASRSEPAPHRRRPAVTAVSA